MQYLFAEKWYGQADFVSYCDKSGTSIYGRSVSIGYASGADTYHNARRDSLALSPVDLGACDA